METKEKSSGLEEMESSKEEETRMESEYDKKEELEEPAEKIEPEKDPLDLLNEKLESKEKELAEQRNAYLRLQAETENFKKRIRKEKEDFVQYANEKLLKELLHIHDDLERALSASNPTVNSLKEGLEMILKQFAAFLEKEKVESIPSVGNKFDPTCHEIMTQIESAEHEENTVIQEYRKGYLLNGRVMRPAQVVTSKLPAQCTDPSKEKSPKKSREKKKSDSDKNQDS